MSQVVDYEQRRQALDPTRSFICEAPAGSGKTELLTQRFLTLLARVQKPEEILAMTFTRKAAGEMRTRVIRALEHAQTSSEPESEHAKLTWRLARAVLEQNAKYHWQILDSPARLQIKTFDSLCSSLANTLPIHSSFASPPQVSDEPDVLYLTTARKFIKTLEDDKPWSDSIAKILGLLDNNTQKLERLFVSMLAKREAWLPLVGHGADVDSVIGVLEERLQTVRAETISHLVQCIPNESQSRIIALASFAASNLHRMEIASVTASCLNMDVDSSDLPESDDAGIQQWLGIANILLTGTHQWRKSVDKRCGFPAGDNAEEKKAFKTEKQSCVSLIATLAEQPGLLEALRDLRYLPAARYDSEQRDLLVAVVQVLPILSAYLSVVFQEKNAVDFSEISLKARIALGRLAEPTDLALALDYKIHHILVDEFQDTSPAQIELLQALTWGWEPDSERTLFCVGDAMQSIYSFRDANVGLFLQCIENGLGDLPLTPLRLTANFRSQGHVVDWVNHVFEQSFPNKHDVATGAVSYSPSVPFDQTRLDGCISLQGFGEGTTLDDEAQHVLSLVQSARAESPNGSIGILVRNRSHITHIAPVLKEAGFNFRSVDLEPLSSNEVVQDILSLTKALLYPSDRVSWLSVLRAPWCGASLEELLDISNIKDDAGMPLTLWQQLSRYITESSEVLVPVANEEPATVQGDLFSDSPVSQADAACGSEERIQFFARVVSVLQDALENSRRKTLRQWVEGTWLALGGPACLATPQEIEHAQLYFSLLERLDASGELKRKDALDKAVEKLFSLPDADSDENLQIMTIHKSKGLEFDTVIVPSLQKSPKSNDPELLRWYERVNDFGESTLLLSPITGSGKDKDPVEGHLAWQEKKRAKNEYCRLLYVACTRARERLHLLAHFSVDSKKSKNGDPSLRAPANASLMATIWDAVKLQLNLLSRDEDEGSGVGDVKLSQTLKRLPSRWELPEFDHGRSLEAYVPYFQHDNQQLLNIQWPSDVPRLVGICIHRLLKSLTAEQLCLWSKNGFSSMPQAWRSQLAYAGVPLSKLPEALILMESIVQGLCDDSSVHWLFDSTLERHPEFEMTLSSQSGVRQLIADLVVCDAETTWIVDYKTSSPDPEQSIEAFIDSEQWTYKDIMFQYRNAVKKMGYRNIKLALYFPMIGRWIEYDQQSSPA